MKGEKRILVAFLLNLFFALFEFIGGVFCKSIAVISDSLHDIGDAVSIGICFFLERKAAKQPDQKYTYGYLRFSVLGGFITSAILVLGSVLVIASAIEKMFNPSKINYNGVLILAILGVVINTAAVIITKYGENINQKAVNLHMLEDVLGWIAVLIGAVVMRLTNFNLIDPILSVGVAIFILFNALKNFKPILNIFLEKAPEDVSQQEIINTLKEIDGILDVHHIHLRYLNENNIDATMHIVTNKDPSQIKQEVRHTLIQFNITHSTLELEAEDQVCKNPCKTTFTKQTNHHCHHH